eukprot:scaffold4899_cov377-Prasinococcus_capsulatus_cf.AAC.5
MRAAESHTFAGPRRSMRRRRSVAISRRAQAAPSLQAAGLVIPTVCCVFRACVGTQVLAGLGVASAVAGIGHLRRSPACSNSSAQYVCTDYLHKPASRGNTSSDVNCVELFQTLCHR